MSTTFSALCQHYADSTPAHIPSAAFDAAAKACDELQSIHETIPAGPAQSAAVKEIFSTVSQLENVLSKRASDYYNGLEKSIRSTFQDDYVQQMGAIRGMLHITGNKILKLFPDSPELVQLANSAKAKGDEDRFPYRIVQDGNRYEIVLTHFHDGKPVDDSPKPKPKTGSFVFHIVLRDGKHIVEQIGDSSQE